MSSVSILHFNDVYRVQPFKVSPSSKETIDVTQFAAMLHDLRGRWPLRHDGSRDGLVLFSGDVFSPSIESSVTRGSHMVPVMNELQPDISLAGNHDFDFGFPHLSKLVLDSNFPWLLSNVIDATTNSVPEPLREFQVLERAGVRIGIIGLVEKEWISTISSWPPNFEYRDVSTVGMDLSRRLRDPDGEHRCDIIICLTHARIPNDIKFAKLLAAHSPAVQDSKSTASSHGVDIILGGHDHLYFASKGVTSWEGYDINRPFLGAEQDEGDVLVVKSGNDFRDLTELTLELEDTPEGSIRRKLIKRAHGRRHGTQPGYKRSETMSKLLKKLLSSVSSSLKSPVCRTEVVLDCQSAVLRLGESAAGNWFADVLRHAFDDALCLKGCGGSDGVLICGGTIRGDSTYGPGEITLGDILEILPFDDSTVVLEVDGETLWAALEAALSLWPAQEGRFPIVSGFRVSWDSRRPAGQRILGIWLVSEPTASTSSTPLVQSGTSTPIRPSPTIPEDDQSQHHTLVDIWEVKREKGGRKYKIVTREYLAEGHDGFTDLKGQKYLIDDEGGQVMSTIVRKYLLGCRFVKSVTRARSLSETQLLHADSKDIINREKARQERYSQATHSSIANKWRLAASRALIWSREHYRDHISVSEREHMSQVDCFDGDKARKTTANEDEEQNESGGEGRGEEDDLVVIHPAIDGRLRDEARA